MIYRVLTACGEPVAEYPGVPGDEPGVERVGVAGGRGEGGGEVGLEVLSGGGHEGVARRLEVEALEGGGPDERRRTPPRVQAPLRVLRVRALRVPSDDRVDRESDLWLGRHRHDRARCERHHPIVRTQSA